MIIICPIRDHKGCECYVYYKKEAKTLKILTSIQLSRFCLHTIEVIESVTGSFSHVTGVYQECYEQ